MKDTPLSSLQNELDHATTQMQQLLPPCNLCHRPYEHHSYDLC